MLTDEPPFALTFPSDLRLLPLARVFLETACVGFGCDRPTTDAIVLAGNEALQNVIRHAHRDRPDATVSIRCHPTGDGLVVVVLDQGDPFNIDTVPDLDPSELRIGGRGVYLMRKLMDELTCQPRTCGGNQLLMVKRFPGGCRRPRAG
jgi:anti-sigma regulatory factor (Ser/Thr protein kinase)